MPNSITKALVVLVVTLILAFGLYFSLRWLKQVWFIPIQVVSITNELQYADRDEIKAAVIEHVKQGFFGLNIAAIRSQLKQVPWIADANVQRSWPDAVKIKLTERQPLAIWQNRGIIDTEGKVFFPVSIANAKGLPEFNGASDSVDEMVDMYLQVLAAVKPIGLAVNKLELMPDHGWRARLDNGLTLILGQAEIEERLRRFVLAYSVLRDKPMTAVDMRYTNGLSVEP